MSELKQINAIESRLVTSVQNLVRSLEIEHNIKFSNIHLVISEDGSTGYSIQVQEQPPEI